MGRALQMQRLAPAATVLTRKPLSRDHWVLRHVSGPRASFTLSGLVTSIMIYCRLEDNVTVAHSPASVTRGPQDDWMIACESELQPSSLSPGRRQGCATPRRPASWLSCSQHMRAGAATVQWATRMAKTSWPKTIFIVPGDSDTVATSRRFPALN